MVFRDQEFPWFINPRTDSTSVRSRSIKNASAFWKAELITLVIASASWLSATRNRITAPVGESSWYRGLRPGYRILRAQSSREKQRKRNNQPDLLCPRRRM